MLAAVGERESRCGRSVSAVTAPAFHGLPGFKELPAWHHGAGLDQRTCSGRAHPPREPGDPGPVPQPLWASASCPLTRRDLPTLPFQAAGPCFQAALEELAQPRAWGRGASMAASHCVEGTAPCGHRLPGPQAHPPHACRPAHPLLLGRGGGPPHPLPRQSPELSRGGPGGQASCWGSQAAWEGRLVPRQACGHGGREGNPRAPGSAPALSP